MRYQTANILQGIRQSLAFDLDPESIDAPSRANGDRWRYCLITTAATIYWLVSRILSGTKAIEVSKNGAGSRFTQE